MSLVDIPHPEGFYKTESGLYIPDKLMHPENQIIPDPFNLAINTDFADPFVLNTGDKLLAFATHTDGVDQPDYIISAEVKDSLLDWQVNPWSVLSRPPEWANAYYTWAPSVRYNPTTDLFNLYYSTSADGKTMGISVAESMYPDRDFRDFSKEPLVGGIPHEIDIYNRTIDPDVYVNNNGQLMLVFGSAGIPIYEQPLNPDGKSFVKYSIPRAKLKPVDHEYEWRIEAGSVETNLFGKTRITYAGNDCFGNGTNRFGNYAVMQARLNEETGRFERPTDVDPTLADNALLEGNENWKNPGHQKIFTLNGENGEELAFLITSVIDRSNQYHPNSRKNRRPAVISRVLEKDGWLYIPGGKFSEDAKAVIGQFR